jgi:beta-galactosidase
LQSDIVAPGGEIVASRHHLKIRGGQFVATLVQELKVSRAGIVVAGFADALHAEKPRQIRRGTVVDETETPFGIRTATLTRTKGFFLNGVSTKLKGVCLHHDAGSLGAAVPEKVLERRLRELKEIGVNAIRTSHNPPDPELLDLCDRLGFLVMDEAFDEFTPGKNKWVTGWNNGVPDHFGYNEIFAQWSVTDISGHGPPRPQSSRHHPLEHRQRD